MATTKITVNKNGSLKVEGDFEVVDMDGNRVDKLIVRKDGDT